MCDLPDIDAVDVPDRLRNDGQEGVRDVLISIGPPIPPRDDPVHHGPTKARRRDRHHRGERILQLRPNQGRDVDGHTFAHLKKLLHSQLERLSSLVVRI